MKKLFAFIILLFLSVNCFATDYTDDVECVGAWTFTEGSGDTDDVSTNSNTGTFKAVGEPAWSSTKPAFASNSADADGSDDYISMGDITALDGATSWTVVFFLYPDALAVGKRYVSKWSASSAQQTFTVEANDTNSDELTLAAHNVGANSYKVSHTTNADLANGNWYCIGVRYDGSDFTVRINKSNKTIANDLNNSITLDNSSGDFRLFAATDGGFANAKITHAAIFRNKQLSDVELDDIADNGLTGGGAPPAATTVSLRRRMIMSN